MSGRGSSRHTAMLVLLAAGMFGFAFALVPLYDIFCEITGLNGKTSAQALLQDEIASATQDADRAVTIEFLSSVGRGLASEFHPNDVRLTVTPGELTTTTYFFRNRAATPIVAQAVPSVSPGRAAAYVKKLECFCFEPQTLAAGESLDMPVRFLIDSDLPAEIGELTLSYTMYPLDAVEHQHVASHEDPEAGVR